MSSVPDPGRAFCGFLKAKRRFVVVVEMGGVEPPSRKVGRKYATSVVARLLSSATTRTTKRQADQSASLCPTPTDTCIGRIRLSDISPAPPDQCGETRYLMLGSEGQLRLDPSVCVGSYLPCPFNETGRLGLQSPVFLPCRNQSSPGAGTPTNGATCLRSP